MRKILCSPVHFASDGDVAACRINLSRAQTFSAPANYLTYRNVTHIMLLETLRQPNDFSLRSGAGVGRTAVAGLAAALAKRVETASVCLAAMKRGCRTSLGIAAGMDVPRMVAK